MKITHETTIEEYEAWLKTNPPLSQLKRAVNATFKMVYAALRSIKRLINGPRKKSRSCLSVAYTLYPLAYDRNAVNPVAGFKNWREEIAIELSKTRDHIKNIQLFDCLEGKVWASEIFDKRQERIASIEDDMAMERVYAEALELLIFKN